MTRRPLALLAAPVLLATLLTACHPAPDDDTCVPPSPSPTGAPWREADDGEPCVPDGAGGWVEAPDADGHGVKRPRTSAKSTRATRATVPTKPTRSAKSTSRKATR